MHSQDQGLPSASEVLLCSETTTAEEVELLFRRAVGLHVTSGQCWFKLLESIARVVSVYFSQHI